MHFITFERYCSLVSRPCYRINAWVKPEVDLSSKTLSGDKSRCLDKKSNQNINRMILLLARPQLLFKDLSCLQNMLLNYHNRTDPLWISLLNALTLLASVITCGTNLYSLTMHCARKYFILVPRLWQTDPWSVPWLSCYKKIIISIYFMCADRGIWVQNQLPLRHFLSHLNSCGLVVLEDRAEVIWWYLNFL